MTDDLTAIPMADLRAKLRTAAESAAKGDGETARRAEARREAYRAEVARRQNGCTCVRGDAGKLLAVDTHCDLVSEHLQAGEIVEQDLRCGRCGTMMRGYLVTLCDGCLAWVNTLPPERARAELSKYVNAWEPN